MHMYVTIFAFVGVTVSLSDMNNYDQPNNSESVSDCRGESGRMAAGERQGRRELLEV